MMKSSLFPMRATKTYTVYFSFHVQESLTLLYQILLHSPNKHLQYHHKHSIPLQILLSINKIKSNHSNYCMVQSFNDGKY